MIVRAGALFSCALLGAAAAQEPPAATPERSAVAPEASGPRREASWLRARNLTASGAALADEGIVVAEQLEIELVDAGIELRADHAILWGDRDLLEQLLERRDRDSDDPLQFGPRIPAAEGRVEPPRADGRGWIGALREIYAEGHVLLRQTGPRGRSLGVAGGEEVVLADRLYFHLLERRGIVLDADAYSRQLHDGQLVDVHVRAQVLRALGDKRFAAEEAQFSTCPYGHPHWHVQSDALDAELVPGVDPGEERARIGLAGNRLELADVPVLPLPPFTADPSAGSSLPLKELGFGHSKKFGAFGESLWGASLPDEAAALREQLRLERPLELQWEAEADFYSRRGVGLGPGLDWSSPGTIEGEIGGYWLRDRADQDFSQDFEIEHPDRGRAYFRNRYQLDEDWRLDTEVNWFSDAGFQPEFFEQEFKEEKEPESYAHLVRQRDTTRARLLYRNRLNDFQTQVDSLPQGSFEQVGEPLWALPLPGFLERDGQPNYLVLTHAEEVANYRFHPAEDSGLDPERVVRADSVIELSTTLPVGPIALRPFTAGEFTAWDRGSADGDNLGRAAGTAGARAQLQLHRNYDAFSHALGIDGLRHVALLDADYVNVYDVSRDPAELVQIDERDALEEREVYVLALRQRLQTHRPVRTSRPGATAPRATETVPPDGSRPPPVIDAVVDLFELDLEVPLYPHAERDNVGVEAGRTAGHTAGPLHYDFVHRPAFTHPLLRDAQLFAEGDWNLHESTMDEVNLGATLIHRVDVGLLEDTAWATTVWWRSARGISDVITAQIDWRIAEKWSIAALEQYDLDDDDSLEHRFLLRRHGHDFNFELGFEHDGGDGDTSITFTIYPSFFFRSRAERGLGAGRGNQPSLIAPKY